MDKSGTYTTSSSRKKHSHLLSKRIVFKEKHNAFLIILLIFKHSCLQVVTCFTCRPTNNRCSCSVILNMLRELKSSAFPCDVIKHLMTLVKTICVEIASPLNDDLVTVTFIIFPTKCPKMNNPLCITDPINPKDVLKETEWYWWSHTTQAWYGQVYRGTQYRPTTCTHTRFNVGPQFINRNIIYID